MRKPASRGISVISGAEGPVGPPGVPPTAAAGLLVGVYAQVTLSTIGTLHLFEGELRITQSLVQVTGHGDEWEQWVPLRQSWTARLRGYLTRAVLPGTASNSGR